MNADAVFEAARQLGELIVRQRAARRQAVKDARNARRRQRYASRPRTSDEGVTPVWDEPDYEPECRCRVIATPPCTWCENGGQEGEE